MSTRALLLGAGLLAILAGCNALLGIEEAVHDVPPTPSDAGGTADAKANRQRTEDGAVIDEVPADGGIMEPDPPEPGACVELETNPRHCGACNHDCGPGECKAGKCQPGVLATDVGGPLVLLVTEKHAIYQTETGDVRRVSLFGGAPVTVFAQTTAQGLGHNMVVIGDHFYFADRAEKRVARCPLTGACTPETIVGEFPKPYSLATANGDLYVANGIAGNTIVVCKSPPCAQQEVFATNEVGITLIAASATDLAWSTITPQGVGGIRTRPLSGGQARTLFSKPGSGLLGATSLLIHNRDVFAVFVGELTRYALDSTVTFVLDRVGPTYTLSFDGVDFWYGDYGTGDIFRYQIVGASVLEVDSDAPLHAAVKRPNDILWISKNRVMRWVR